MPFEEIQHTADWALRIWAGSLPELFAEAARGMNAISGTQPAPGPSVRRTLETRAPDAESLLVAFLSELVYAAEQDHLVFNAFEIELQENKLKVSMVGVPLLSLNKPIKAVTYHNLLICKTNEGFQVEMVFDV